MCGRIDVAEREVHRRSIRHRLDTISGRVCVCRDGDLRRVARVGQFLDVVHETVELPLSMHFGAAAQREVIEPLVMPQIGKHRLDGGEALPILRAADVGVDAHLHPHRVRLAGLSRVLLDAPAKEGDVPHRRRVGRAKTLSA